MAATITCPLCGMENPPDQKTCQRCQTPLSGEAYQTGQSPVKKNTGELEPILPQWLKDARESAKQAGMIEPSAPAAGQNQPSASNPDLLAGLQSQAGDDDEEDVPDWLANITGKAAPKQKYEDPQTETGGVRWVEMGKKDDFFQTDPPAEEDVPSWLAGIQTPAPGAEEKDELTDWFRQAEQKPAEPAASLPEAASGDTPDWLKQMAAEAGELKKETTESDASFDSLDWFSRAEPGLGLASQPPAETTPPEDPPDWLRQMSAGAEPVAPQPAASTADAPDWLQGLGGIAAGFVESAPAESEAVPSDEEGAESGKSDSTPLWLQESEGASLPAWLSPQQEAQPAFENMDMPDWLKAAAPQSSIEEPSSAETPAEASFDGMAGLQDAFPAGGGDSLFTEMPDWLSNPVESAQAGVMPEAITGSDALAPDALPSWVEAMRPSDQNLPGMGISSSDQTLEARGALAGLQGVLPSGAGFTPTSKPKAYSIKLTVSEEQQAHAAILERALAAETSPVTLASERALGASRPLRWAIAFILFAAALTAALMRTQVFSMPVGVPRELGYAVSIVQSLPEDAPVLVAVDYEPARAGEMEAAAAPLFDHMLLLKHPRLTFISSNETGAILAERFLAGPLAGHHYQSGVSYVNLGYLAGGQMGIRAFAQNPSFAAPMDIVSQPAWGFPPLQGVTALNQFAAIIIVTDNADAARAWIEQSGDARGSAPVIVVSSAQAAPMIQPYYDSGQAAGMVSGLYGGAIIEAQYNGGRPGAARSYWDAYSIGMILAMMFTLGGGFLNLALGLKDRAAAREGN